MQGTDSKQPHILLVDDEEELLSLLAETLADLKYQVTSTTNARCALELFTAAPDKYHVIISDNNMPFLSGGDLATAARKLRHNIPVILISGDSEEAVLEQIAVPVKVLTKPFDDTELNAAIRNLLS